VFAATWPQSDDQLSFGALAFRNVLEHRNFNFSSFGNDFCTSNKLLVRFGAVTPDFNTQQFVEAASNILLG